MIDTLEIGIHKVDASRLSEIDFHNIPFGKVFTDHMFAADYHDGEWHDLRIVPYGPMRVSPANVTLHYGQSVFEGMKGYKNAEEDVMLFRPLDNHRRLNISARRMCLAEVPEELFMGGLTQLLTIDKDWIPSIDGTSLYIRPFIYATEEYIGIKPSSNFRFMIIACPVGAYYSKPVRVKIETKYSRAAPGGTGHVKAAGNYGGSLYPARLAQEDGFDQLIWTDALTHSQVEEAGTMNVMFLINDTLVTAPTGDTILKGLTRDSVLQLAREWGYKVEERPVRVQEILDAIGANILKEAFGTGTAATVSPIAVIGHNDQQFALPEDRSLAKRLRKTLEEIKTGKVEDKYGWTYKV